MKEIKISENNVEQIINDALKYKKKNILFISHTINDKPILEWFENSSGDYRRIYCQPAPLYFENKNGRLEKAFLNGEEIAVIPTFTLEAMNNEQSIVFMDYFGQRSIYGFDRFMDIIKYRYYINLDEEGNLLKKSDVSKMALLIAMSGDDGGYEVPEDDYQYFDDVYILEY